MKTIMLILIVILAAGCGSRKQAGCDAYGDSRQLKNSGSKLKDPGCR